MFRYCPRCASARIEFDGKNRLSCPDCGFVYFHNTAAAAGLIISTKQGFLFLVRGEEPMKGKLDVPGGFLNPGESAIEGLLRECREEIGRDCGGDVRFLASFPNIYDYGGVSYNTCDLFFIAEMPDLTAEALTLQVGEVDGCRFILPANIDFAGIAFESARRAVRLDAAGPLA